MPRSTPRRARGGIILTLMLASLAGGAGAQTALERGRYLRPDRLNGTNRLEIGVYWNDKVGQGQLIARLDNLGKGASGSCVQVLNLISGLPEERA